MLFYEPATRDRSLFPHDPFKALVAPRPIGWVSTISTSGHVNLAPYSFFNAFNSQPAIVGFASEGEKDSLRNVRETREFVWNMATYALRDAMNATSATLPPETDEFDVAGLARAPCRLVRPPRVAASPAALECRLLEVVPLRDLDGRSTGTSLVLGQVVGVHIDEAFLFEGRVDTAAMQPLARGGYADYSTVDRSFALRRPD